MGKNHNKIDCVISKIIKHRRSNNNFIEISCKIQNLLSHIFARNTVVSSTLKLKFTLEFNIYLVSNFALIISLHRNPKSTELKVHETHKSL